MICMMQRNEFVINIKKKIERKNWKQTKVKNIGMLETSSNSCIFLEELEDLRVLL